MRSHPAPAARRPVLLVIHPGALGDVLLAIPALRALRLAYPGHSVALVSDAGVGALLQACGEIDRLFPLDRTLWRFMGGDADVPQSLRLWLERCDRAVAWLEDRDGRLHTFLEAWKIVPLFVGSVSRREPQERHQAELLLESLDLRASDSIWRPLELPQSLRARGAALLATSGLALGGWRLGVHPGSGSHLKCVDPSRLASLVADLEARGASVCLLEGPADVDAVARVRALTSHPLPVIRDLDVPAVAGVLANLEQFIGHDSGVTHLAAAVGCRTVALFGPTSAARWAPWGMGVDVVRGRPCRCPTWDEIRRCPERPCLAVPVEPIVELCLRRRGICRSRLDPSACSPDAHVLQSPPAFPLK